jgi:hypothetical protein
VFSIASSNQPFCLSTVPEDEAKNSSRLEKELSEAELLFFFLFHSYVHEIYVIAYGVACGKY